LAQLGNCCETTSTSTCCVNDSVCCTVDLKTGDGVGGDGFYVNTSSFAINGTVMVENNGAPGTPAAGVFINGISPAAFTVEPGECKSRTFDVLNRIDITGVGGTGTSSVKVSYSLNYKF